MNNDGLRLYSDAVDHHYEVMGPTSPTHYDTHGRCSVIDLAIYKGLTSSPELTVLDDLTSDHRPVLLTLASSPVRVVPNNRRGKICWEEYQGIVEENITTRPIETAIEVEQAAEEITTVIRNSLKEATTQTNTPAATQALPAWIKELIRDKRECRVLWQQSRCPRTKSRLNRLVEEVRTALDEHASKGWEDLIDEVIREHPPSVHRLCRSLTRTPTPVRPLLDEDGLLKFTAQDRAEIFASCLEKQFKPNETSNQAHVEEIERANRDYLERPLNPEEEEANKIFFKPSWVKRVSKKLPNRKAPGLDEIPNEAIKKLPPKAVVAVTRLFNGILRSGHFPTIWKTGKVVVIPKPGKDTRRPESYRPITLLNSISKLFEKLLLYKLLPHVRPREEQFGFRAEHSTTLQLTRILHYMATAHNKKEYVAAVFLDIEKAFDRVWHQGLLHKLSTSSAPRRIVQILASYLEERKFVVSVEGQLSTAHPIAAGVPQGSCLSPVCYAWYTNDIPVVGQAHLALYADDAAFYASSIKPHHAARKLEKALEDLPEWLDRWRMSVNVDKSQAILTSRCTHPPPPMLMGKPINWTRTVKYLGVKIDRNMTFKEHIKDTVGMAKFARAKLMPVLKSRLPLRTKLGIYKTYIRSRLTYAGPAWYAYASTTNRKALQSQENQCLRAIVGAPRYVRNSTIAKDLKTESIDNFVSRLATNMFARADKSSLAHIKGIAPLHARPPDQKGKRRSKPFARDLVREEEEE